jgi:hypothetical protein
MRAHDEIDEGCLPGLTCFDSLEPRSFHDYSKKGTCCVLLTTYFDSKSILGDDLRISNGLRKLIRVGVNCKRLSKSSTMRSIFGLTDQLFQRCQEERSGYCNGIRGRWELHCLSRHESRQAYETSHLG